MTAGALQAAVARGLTVLGSTGTIGRATLDVVRLARERYGEGAFPIEALTAQRNVALLAQQARAFRPQIVVIGDERMQDELTRALAGTGIAVAAGERAIEEAADRPAGIVMSAIVGAAGLAPTLAAVRRGALVALANKECVVAASEVFRRELAKSRATVIPVDSEHNAAFQIIDLGALHAIECLTLTASGGPFRTWTTERMETATPDEAVAHPNWSMGAKISVDSATLMNKGLELIEAHVLFGLAEEQLDIVIHAQSIVHCLVAYADGSVLAHLSEPDMRTPIAHALAWPSRMASPSPRLDPAALSGLSFERPDSQRFPCLRLARHCLQTGGAAPTILNAANEVAVEAFLNRRIGFLGIARAVERTLETIGRHANGEAPATLEDVLAVDAEARIRAWEACGPAAA